MEIWCIYAPHGEKTVVPEFFDNGPDGIDWNGYTCREQTYSPVNKCNCIFMRWLGSWWSSKIETVFYLAKDKWTLSIAFVTQVLAGSLVGQLWTYKGDVME